jgi:hypothetical protein
MFAYAKAPATASARNESGGDGHVLENLEDLSVDALTGNLR